jgi:DNA invertase Pin-like site-specific DNA recombinase
MEEKTQTQYPKNVVIYARISTNRGEQNIKQQIDYCKKYAIREGLNVIKVFKDEESGKNKDRRGYVRLKGYFEQERADTGILMQDSNRSGRDYYEGVEFEKFVRSHSIRLISISESINLNTANGRLMFRFKNAMNAFYVEDLIDKIHVGVARAKAEGKYKGRKKGAFGKNRHLPKSDNLI